MLEGSRLELAGGWNRPPMEMCDTSMAVFERARAIGSTLDLDLRWVRWGGSSDANLTAAEGTPTVDGLGPVGEGSHQRSESIDIAALPARMALFAELVASLANPTPRVTLSAGATHGVTRAPVVLSERSESKNLPKSRATMRKSALVRPEGTLRLRSLGGARSLRVTVGLSF